MSEKIEIELNPYNAISILAFLRQSFNEENSSVYKYKAMHEATDELEQELVKKLKSEDWDEINARNEIDKLIGKVPG